MEEAPFTRATYINQARVHMGYHYPRSLSTAMNPPDISSVLQRTIPSVFIPRFNRFMLLPLIFLDGCGGIFEVLPGWRDPL